MDHVEYVYTSGMSESDIDDYLRAGEHGVLGLASDDDSYAIPLSYHYDGDRFLVRVSEHDGDSTKGRFLDTTETATFVCYRASTDESWSIHVRGQIEPWNGDVDEAALNEWFQPFRLFDEAVDRVGFSLYDLEMETVVGRQTVE